jgi:hypothetical protein
MRSPPKTNLQVCRLSFFDITHHWWALVSLCRTSPAASRTQRITAALRRGHVYLNFMLPAQGGSSYSRWAASRAHRITASLHRRHVYLNLLLPRKEAAGLVSVSRRGSRPSLDEPEERAGKRDAPTWSYLSHVLHRNKAGWIKAACIINRTSPAHVPD